MDEYGGETGGTMRRVRIDPRAGSLFAEIRLDGGPPRTRDAIPWRIFLSLHAAGHMGRETAARRGNRARLLRSLGLDPARVFGTTQVHGRTVLPVGGEIPGDFAGREADGLVTDRPDAVLSVTAADCLPIALFSRSGEARALVHSGWKGTGIAASAVGVLRTRYGVPASEIEAVIGPGIGACCYEVDRSRYGQFISEFGPESGAERNGRCFLDLRAANAGLLRSVGIRSVTVIDDCTCCGSAFGSYRRDGRDGFHNMLVLFGRITGR